MRQKTYRKEMVKLLEEKLAGHKNHALQSFALWFNFWTTIWFYMKVSIRLLNYFHGLLWVESGC